MFFIHLSSHISSFCRTISSICLLFICPSFNLHFSLFLQLLSFVFHQLISPQSLPYHLLFPPSISCFQHTYSSPAVPSSSLHPSPPTLSLLASTPSPVVIDPPSLQLRPPPFIFLSTHLPSVQNTTGTTPCPAGAGWETWSHMLQEQRKREEVGWKRNNRNVGNRDGRRRGRGCREKATVLRKRKERDWCKVRRKKEKDCEKSMRDGELRDENDGRMNAVRQQKEEKKAP